MDDSIGQYMDKYIIMARKELRLMKEDSKFGFLEKGFKKNCPTLGSLAVLFELTCEMDKQCARSTVEEMASFLNGNGLHDVTQSYAKLDCTTRNPHIKSLDGLLMYMLFTTVNPINIINNMLAKMQLTPLSTETLRLYDYRKYKKTAEEWKTHWKRMHDERIKQQRHGKTSDSTPERNA